MVMFSATRWIRIALFCLLPFSVVTAAEPTQPDLLTLDVPNGPLNIQVVAPQAEPKARLLWLPSEYGILPAEKQWATQLGQSGFESWFVDLYEPLFLPPTPSAVDQVPTEWIAQLIDKARSGGMPLIVVAENMAAQLAVRGWVAVQKTPQHDVGFIFINPNLYVNTPEPGAAARYWPETQAFNAPVFLFQAELSPWRWRMVELRDQLAASGSDVYLKLLPQVRDRFYFRPDALPVEQAQGRAFVGQLKQAISALNFYMAKPRAAGQRASTGPVTVEQTKSTELQPYQGAQDKPLSLEDLNGRPVNLRDYRGKVVLLNFWASWCPPCVHEMPSMARLNTLLKGQPFEILAVNLAEDKPAIETFLHAHPVNFPVLLDPSGSAVQTWQVFAYPSTYLIDKTGRIRYALFGGADWDQPSAVAKIRALLAEPDNASAIVAPRS
ncbi:TlpA disulfide reductase family protein [Halothiobacillus sp.]|uniref:TlpA disulfide reductase family protein n=1 Tax=Halothiobacillus sp. TaxID=1891311 RepID=UPI002AD36E51|nr:TlpA disulfide reductase family protein [Halothiobacillus sp.]